MLIFDPVTMDTKPTIFKAVLILFFIIVVNTVQTYVLHITRQFGDIDFYRIPTHIFGIISCGLSLLSTILAWKVNGRMRLERFPKLLAAFALSIILYSILQSVFFLGERYFIYDLRTEFDMLFGNFVFTFVIFHLYISGLTLAYLTFQENSRNALQLERAENEKEMLHFKMLQKNLEPHFLFNNLSVLSGLVRKNPSEVEGFITDFSDVYRYYLNHNNQELVPLKQEITFLHKYISLLKKRFQAAYEFVIEAEDDSGFILPSSLQLAVENAVKHNRGSAEEPLRIDIKRFNDTIIVCNDLRPVDFTQGSHLGNIFLQKSYEFHFGKKVKFTKTDQHYIVEIPLIL